MSVVQIWVDRTGASPEIVKLALDAEIQSALDEGASLEDIWIVDPPTKWKIVAGR